jgi:leader peptidase (prepilin peptidase) / N-methyltransferase
VDDVVAAVVGLAAGALVAPLADRLATNAPVHQPLLRSVPRSSRLPLVAAATALLGAVCGVAFGLTLEGAAAALFCWLLVVITRTDLEHRLIPDRIVIPGTVLVLALRTIDDPSVEWAVAALATGLVLFVVVLVYPQGLGMGDVKLSALLGAGLGYLVGIAMFVGFFFAFVPAAVLLVRHGRQARKEAIPLGPFLALGAVVTLFSGHEIWDWYRGLGR